MIHAIGELTDLSSQTELERSKLRLRSSFHLDEELLMEVAVQSRSILCERLLAGKQIKHLRAYLNTTENNTLLAEVRRRRKSHSNTPLSDLAEIEAADGGEKSDTNSANLMNCLIARLRNYRQPKYHQLYQLKFVESRTLREIAEEWDVSEPSVHSMLVRMLRLLRRWASEMSL